VRLLHSPEPVEHVMAPLPDGAPARFKWRGRAYKVAAADGPERLYGEWWRHAREQAAVRDYFQVEDETGARFWLFRRGDGEDPETGDLSWYMHGIFA
jgi:protein ImuB